MSGDGNMESCVSRNRRPKPKMKRWVNHWLKLMNPSLKGVQTAESLLSDMRSLGLMERGSFSPTPLAIRRGVARITENNRVQWRLPRWVGIHRKMRKDRRNRGK